MMKRRKLITLAGIALGSLAAGLYRNELTTRFARSRSGDETPHSLAPSISDNICVLTPEQQAGPYALQSPVRSDIREDKTGLIYDLDIQIVDANSVSDQQPPVYKTTCHGKSAAISFLPLALGNSVKTYRRY